MESPGFSTNAILLRKIEYGDHDLIITFLTQDRGKVTVMAKNAKKSVHRYSGALDLFSLNHIQCSFPKKNKDSLVHLMQTDLENGFANIRYDVYKTAYASYWVEMIHFWLEEDRAQPQLYELLLFSLDMLDRSDIRKEILNLLFQIRFMGISGFTPNIEMCESCKTRVDDIPGQTVRFDLEEGRIICPDCSPGRPGRGLDVSKGTLKQLFWMNNADIHRADRIRFSPFIIKEGQVLLESFIPFHIGREFRSLKFLKRLRADV